MRQLDKLFAIIIIVFSIGIPVAFNFNLKLPNIPNSKKYPVLWRQIIAQLNQTDKRLKHLGWLLGLDYIPKMFTPVARSDQWPEYVAIHRDGKETLLPLPLQPSRNGWEHNIIDFREIPFHWKLISPKNEDHLRNYVDYLCRVYQDEYDPIIEIRVDLYSQELFSPTEAREKGRYLGEIRKNLGGKGSFQCKSSSK